MLNNYHRETISVLPVVNRNDVSMNERSGSRVSRYYSLLVLVTRRFCYNHIPGGAARAQGGNACRLSFVLGGYIIYIVEVLMLL